MNKLIILVTIILSTFSCTKKEVLPPIQVDISYIENENGEIQFVNLTQNADSYLWEFKDDNTNSTEKKPLKRYPHNGKFNVVFTALRGAEKIFKSLTVIVRKGKVRYYDFEADDIILRSLALRGTGMDSKNIYHVFFGFEIKSKISIYNSQFNFTDKIEVNLDFYGLENLAPQSDGKTHISTTGKPLEIIITSKLNDKNGFPEFIYFEGEYYDGLKIIGKKFTGNGTINNITPQPTSIKQMLANLKSCLEKPDDSFTDTNFTPIQFSKLKFLMETNI